MINMGKNAVVKWGVKWGVKWSVKWGVERGFKCIAKWTAKSFVKASTLLTLSAVLCACDADVAQSKETVFESLVLASEGAHRSQKNIARNQFRHPLETLKFFDVKADMTVIEISPGALWYTEILAPYLKHQGKLIAAAYDASLEGKPAYQARLTKEMLARFEAEPDFFSAVDVVSFTPPESMLLGDDNSADRVLTFRNTHGWVHRGSAPQVFDSFYKVLKPGGVLGLVQHRGENRLRPTGDKMTGYLSEALVIDLAVAAGFVLEARSEINSNPNDTKDYEEGVWTLPPVLRGSVDLHEQSQAIGESDRMTLKFRKPL